MNDYLSTKFTADGKVVPLTAQDIEDLMWDISPTLGADQDGEWRMLPNGRLVCRSGVDPRDAPR